MLALEMRLLERAAPLGVWAAEAVGRGGTRDAWGVEPARNWPGLLEWRLRGDEAKSSAKMLPLLARLARPRSWPLRRGDEVDCTVW